jgi:hypothetical protein
MNTIIEQLIEQLKAELNVTVADRDKVVAERDDLRQKLFGDHGLEAGDIDVLKAFARHINRVMYGGNLS